MTEQELNIKLSEAMGYIREEATIKCENNSVKYSVLWDENGNQVVDFSYKDPVIFTELVIALLDNDYVIGRDIMDKTYFVQLNRQVDEFGYLVEDKDIFKTVALAFIAMKEVET